MPFFLHQTATDEALLFLEPIRVACLLDRSAIDVFLETARQAGEPILTEPAVFALIRRALAPVKSLDPRRAADFRRSLLRIVETEEPDVLGDQERQVLLQAALDWATGIPDEFEGAIATWIAENGPSLTTRQSVPGLGANYALSDPLAVSEGDESA